jgi:hypothetical protein
MNTSQFAPPPLVTEHLLAPELELGLLVVGFAAFIALLMGMGKLSSLVAMTQQRRQWLERARPVVGVLLGLPYVLFALRFALRDHGQLQWAGWFAIALALSVAAWFAIRDFVAGVVLKAGRVCSEGDLVRLGDHEGRVLDMGLRSLTLETSSGDEAVVPYSLLTKEALIRTPAVQGLALHVFRVATQKPEAVSATRQAIIEAAMCAHWSSVVRTPEVRPLGNDVYEVTVYALDGDHGPDIEAAVVKAPGLKVASSE